MSDTLILANSIWPNGMKVDSDGYAVFYPLGTNKVQVPTSSTQWPKGNKLISPFVYQDDKLVGFIDTKALTTDSQTTIYLPYTHIEADFSAIDKGQLQIHAPKAITKKASWKNSGVEDIAEVQFKYKGCKTLDNVKTVDANYKNADIVDGTWSEPLWDLTNGSDMFINCINLTSWNIDLPSLTDGSYMFKNTSLTTFSSYLSSLTNGYQMFYYCNNLTSFTSDLSSLTNGTRMFNGCSNLTSWNIDLSSLTNGESMFNYCPKLTSFSSDLPSLTNGDSMFSSCTNLTSFSSDLPSLTDGEGMFNRCENLTTWNIDLPSLTDGQSMFQGCSNLSSFSSDLPSLTNGYNMFNYCTKLTSFNCDDLSSLTNGQSMFIGCENLTSFNSDMPSLTYSLWMFEDCSNLSSFSSDLHSLTYGHKMFDGCSKLTSFSSDLSSLTNGYNMFNGCKLDTASVQNIADTIKDVNGLVNDSECSDVWKYIYIGIGNSEPNEQEEAAFNTMVSKGWTVYVNGSEYTPTSPAAITTLDENGEETVTPIPYWAKPVQSDEEHAQYVDEQGNFFIILGGQFIYGDDISTYGMFTCEADAAANMRLTPYIKPQTEIENQ